MNTIKTTLFLHGGPGSNSSVEEKWFRDDPKLNHIQWWDQPTEFKNPENAFDEVVDAAANELRRMATSTTEKISLLAHSFGGQIAVRLLDRHPEYISRVTLLGCAFSLPRAFAQLGTYFGMNAVKNRQNDLAVELNRLSNAVHREPNAHRLWPLLGKITSLENFFHHYWKDERARARYFALTSSMPLNMAASAAILNSLLLSPMPKALSCAQIPVQIFLGTSDPLLNLENEVQDWKQLIPEIMVQTISAGHYIQFESPPEIWGL